MPLSLHCRCSTRCCLRPWGLASLRLLLSSVRISFSLFIGRRLFRILDPARPGVRDSLAHTLMGLNRRDAAIEVLTEELGLSPQSPRTYYLLGKAHLQEKRFTEAIEFYEKALAFDPEFTQAYYECATALVRSGRRQEAKHYREQFQLRSQGEGNTRKKRRINHS